MARSSRLARTAARLGVLGVLLGACSAASPEVADDPADVLAAQARPGEATGDDAPAIEAPGAVQVREPDRVVPEAKAVPVPETVEVHRPDLVVRTAGAASDSLYAAFGVAGVEHVAGAASFEATVADQTGGDVANDGTGGSQSTGGAEPLRVLAVDPTTFRQMTPEVTAQEPGVWQRLAEGDVLVIHEVAHRLGLGLGSTIELDGPQGRVPVRIGAYASNGAPPLADVVVPWEIGSRLGAGEVDTLIVALADGTGAQHAGDEIVAALGGGELEVRQAPQRRQARTVHTPGRTTIEPFTYTDLGDGMIVIDPAWVRKWIVTVDLPGLGRTRCHRVMAVQLFAALEEIHEAGLYDHLRPDQFAGCYVPRHIDWNPSRPLSMHAWGLAVDFNSIDNRLGQTPRMDRRIVAIFEKWGFEWGGWWSRPDGMHFELDRIVHVE